MGSSPSSLSTDPMSSSSSSSSSGSEGKDDLMATSSSPCTPSSPSMTSSCGTGNEGNEDNDKFIHINFPAVFPIIQCPICLDVIQNTIALEECLDRFCKECIEKALRFGYNECPKCRTLIADHSSLREDQRFNSIIAAINMAKEEMALDSDEIIRNKKFQALFAEIEQRQMEARKADDEQNGTSKTLSSSQRTEHFVDSSRDAACRGGGTSEVLSMEKASSKSPLQSTSEMLIDELDGDNIDDEMNIHLILAPLDEQSKPNLDQPYLRGKHNCSIKELCEFIAIKMELKPEELEMVCVKNGTSVLEETETLETLCSTCMIHGNMVLSYRFKDLGNSGSC